MKSRGVIQLIKIRNRSSREKNRRTGCISASDSAILSALISQLRKPFKLVVRHTTACIHAVHIHTYVHIYTTRIKDPKAWSTPRTSCDRRLTISGIIKNSDAAEEDMFRSRKEKRITRMLS